MDDQALVDAVLAGDRDAFATVVQREGDVILRISYRILRDLAEAEDATQETFVAAFLALPTYRGEGSLRAWLSRIATRQALRKRATRPSTTRRDAVTETLPDDRSDTRPENAALAGERRDALVRSLDELPTAHRDIVILKYFGGLTLTEIADATGRPLGTVKTHLHRALERLRSMTVEGSRE